MNNVLFDSNLGDVTSIAMQTVQASVGIFGTIQASSGTVSAGAVVASQVAVSGTVTVAAPGGIKVPVNSSINVTATTDTFAAAVALTAGINVVTSAAYSSATFGAPVALPSAATFVGGSICVFNLSTHTVAVWPQAADQIDVLGTTVAVLLNPGLRGVFWGILAPNGTTALGQVISQAAVTSV